MVAKTGNAFWSLYSNKGSPTQKKRVNLGIAQKGGVGGGVETLAQIVFGSSTVNINQY